MTQIDISQFLFYQSSRPRTLDKLSNPIATNSVESIHTQSKQATPTTFTSQSKESTLDKSIADLTTIITVDDAIENVADSNKIAAMFRITEPAHNVPKKRFCSLTKSVLVLSQVVLFQPSKFRSS